MCDTKIYYKKQNDVVEIPLMGWKLPYNHNLSLKEVRSLAKYAIQLGYRVFYFENADEFEKVIAEVIYKNVELGRVARKDIFIIAKWNSLQFPKLMNLREYFKVSYFDLVIIEEDNKLVERGVLGLMNSEWYKSYGCTNMTKKQIDALADKYDCCNVPMRAVIGEFRNLQREWINFEDFRNYFTKRHLSYVVIHDPSDTYADKISLLKLLLGIAYDVNFYEHDKVLTLFFHRMHIVQILSTTSKNKLKSNMEMITFNFDDITKEQELELVKRVINPLL